MLVTISWFSSPDIGLPVLHMRNDARISGVPQLQVIRMERLYGYSDTSYMIGVFPIALLTAEFGQVWAEHV